MASLNVNNLLVHVGREPIPEKKKKEFGRQDMKDLRNLLEETQNRLKSLGVETQSLPSLEDFEKDLKYFD